MNRSKRLMRGSATKAVNFSIALVVSFFLMPFLVRSLGDQGYGVWTLVGTLLGYYGLLDVGLSSAVVRFISRAVGLDDSDDFRRTFATSFYLFLALGAAAIVFTLILSALLPLFVHASGNLNLYRALVLILGISIAIDFPVRAFNSVFLSNLREDISTGISIVKTLVCTIFIVAVINRGGGVLGMALVTVFFSLLDSIARVVLAYVVEPRTTINPKYVDWSKIKPLFGYSVYAFIGRIANILRFRLDQVVITAFVSLAAVTHYFVATRLLEYMTDFIWQLVSVVTPMFSQDEGRNNYEGIRRNFLYLSKICGATAIFAGGMILIHGRSFIHTWMGPGYDDSVRVLYIFLVPITLQLVQSPVIPVLDGISKHRYYVYSNVVEGVANLALSLLLVRKYGMEGVAWGTAIPMTIKLLVAQPIYACRAIRLNLSTYLSQFAVQNVLSVSLIAVGWLIVRNNLADSYKSIVLNAAVQAAIFWPLILWWGFNEEERSRLFAVIVHAIPFRKVATATN